MGEHDIDIADMQCLVFRMAQKDGNGLKLLYQCNLRETQHPWPCEDGFGLSRSLRGAPRKV